MPLSRPVILSGYMDERGFCWSTFRQSAGGEEAGNCADVAGLSSAAERSVAATRLSRMVKCKDQIRRVVDTGKVCK